MFSDDQKRQMLEHQKNSFSFGELIYDAGGLDGARSVSGWVGYSDMGVVFSPLGAQRSGAVMAIVIQDIHESMYDQEQLQVPMARVISVRAAPITP